MLWLSALMGLLAVCAFTLLWFLPVKRRDEEEAIEDAIEEPAGAERMDGDEKLSDELDEEFAGIAEPEVMEDAAAEIDADVMPDGQDTITFSRDEWDVERFIEDPAAVAEHEAELAMALGDEALHGDEADDWFSAGPGTAEFEDFDPDEEDLVVVWDDSHGSSPSVQIVRKDDDPALACVLLGDTILAQFRTKADASYDQVALVPLSTARSLGWAHP